MKTPAQNLALGFLRKTVAEHRGAGRPDLPTVRQLASRAGVSHVTMLKAVRALADKGLLRAKRGRGITIQGPSPAGARGGLDRAEAEALRSPAVPKSPRRRWRSLCLELERDILEGVHPFGEPLPSHKELAERYGVCYRTLRRSLDALSAGGSIDPHKRGYRVRSVAGTRTGNTVLLIARGDPHGDVRLWTARTQDLLRAAQGECAKARLNLEVMPFDYVGRLRTSDEKERALRSNAFWDTVLGTVVLPAGIGWSLIPLVRTVSIRSKAIAVLDEGDTHLPADAYRDRRVRVFSMATSPSCGRAVGRYLQALGHTRVAYISTYHAAPWSRNRLEGMRRAYADAGKPGGVEAFTLDSTQPGRGSTREQFGGLLEKPLADRGITAWVGANDAVALACLDYLRDKGRRAPQDVSVAGFDDSLDAFFHELTSYNYNTSAVVHAMLAHILAPRRPAKGLRDSGPVEIEGFINARRTTAARLLH